MRDEIEAFGRKWKRVWQEDDATRNFPNNEGHEYVDGAWKRLFGEPYQRAPMQDAEEDWGDATAVRIGDRLVVSSFDGDSIYVPAESGVVTGTLLVGGEKHEPVRGIGPASADPYTAMVREFHECMGLLVRDAPSLGTPAEREERVRLMQEELLEVARALGVSVHSESGDEIDSVHHLNFTADGTEPDTATVLHELADLQVTVSGTAVQFGLPLLAATREVHAANMRKTPQGPGRKPLKPDGWKPADVSKVLAALEAAHPEGGKWGEPCGRCTTPCSEECAGLPTSEAEYRAAALQEAPGAVLRQLAGLYHHRATE